MTSHAATEVRSLTLRKDKEFALLRGHPWVYGEAFKDVPDDLEMGEAVALRSHKGMDLGLGYVDLDSPILVRRIDGRPGDGFAERITGRITAAVALRRSWFDPKSTDAWRVINGEGDGIPGLVVDRFGTALSLQVYSAGLEPWLDHIVERLRRELPEIKLIWRRDQVKRAKRVGDGLLLGDRAPDSIEFRENGMKFRADLVSGQKTGFFLDQRDNRDLVRRIARGKRVANVCGYTGAFSVAALTGGATSVVTVDLAGPALREAERNLVLNGFAVKPGDLVTADMFAYLEDSSGPKFDLLIVDPPSMAKNRRDVPNALRAYTKLNRLAMGRLNPRGLLFTASCSSQVGRDDFLSAVTDAARSCGRFTRILAETHHGIDHPIGLGHPEGRYLHGLLLEVA